MELQEDWRCWLQPLVHAAQLLRTRRDAPYEHDNRDRPHGPRGGGRGLASRGGGAGRGASMRGVDAAKWGHDGFEAQRATSGRGLNRDDDAMRDAMRKFEY